MGTDTVSVGIGALVLDATPLRGGKWAVRPPGALGTHGFYPYAWEVIYVRASSAVDAVRKAYPKVQKQRGA